MIDKTQAKKIAVDKEKEQKRMERFIKELKNPAYSARTGVGYDIDRH